MEKGICKMEDVGFIEPIEKVTITYEEFLMKFIHNHVDWSSTSGKSVEDLWKQFSHGAWIEFRRTKNDVLFELYYISDEEKQTFIEQGSIEFNLVSIYGF